MTYSFAHGAGTSGDPYQVASAADLKGVRDYPEAYFIQTADIDLSGESSWDPICNGMTESPLIGEYNGNGCTVSNLVITTSDDYFGLFGLGMAGAIKNLKLSGFNLSANDYVGALVGVIDSGFTVENCCVVDSSVDGNDYVGGLIGLAGSTVKDCYSISTVSGHNYLGGLIGLIGASASIGNVYSVGTVTGNQFYGGLIGNSGDAPEADDSYYNYTVCGINYNGWGYPKNTTQMKTQSTYSGWDFTSIWRVDPAINNGYPYLRMAYPLGFQTRKRYVEVIECLSSDPDMTMQYNGKYYKFVSFLEEFAVTTHATAGISITYNYGGDTVEYGGKDYLFIASGITDPAGPGGYGDYKSGTSRTVKSLATRENFVHFYYSEIANADMAIHSPSEIKSANPMIILDAGVSYPIGAKYHFKLTSYADSGAVTQIATVNSKDNPELFKYSLDEGITWKDFPAGGVANTNTKLLVAARLTVGPRAEVWILPSKELVT